MQRELLTEDDLLDRLNKMLLTYEDTEDCHFNAVCWCEEDEFGVNWYTHQGSSGRPVLTCNDAFNAVLEEARKLYQLDKND